MMNENRPSWSDQLGDSPFLTKKFSRELAERIESEARRRQASVSRRRSGRRVAVHLLSGLLVVGGLVAVPLVEPNNKPLPAGVGFHGGERLVYQKDGQALFAVFPDPELKAGRPFGYLFSFEASFSEFQGKRLSVQAIHERTGEAITAVAGVPITAPSPGYERLERWTSSFALPIDGLWRLVVMLDGQEYGDVIVSVRDGDWEASPLFSSGGYRLRGTEGRAGFIDPGFRAGTANKYMWHFWGSPEALRGEFRIRAVRQGSDQLIDVFQGSELGGSNNGADRHLPAMMSLPEPGKWRLLAMIDNRLYDSIVVEVQP
ncbi:DUF4871 domain-containing protein [Paenibacillus puerhi]|uniref:DUF4871 domain-containing protein n=1 Tax=Paenibacillus puerhi TaxID=2692622 RepID=UPI0013576CC8|nr:DUF4871 domain-containing protein [Paenibacillus puerhi]